MWKNKEQPVVKTGKMCRIAQNYEHGRAPALARSALVGYNDRQSKYSVKENEYK